jgi:glycosyltransferase involved in cell wall biosynthesis
VSDDSLEASPPATVDVGIPAYRRPRYLVEAIESVLGQTFTGWSLVISDSEAPRSEIERAVASYLDDRRITYVARERNAAENWTSLIQAGAAPYVALLHDDDRWHPDFLRRRVEFLERHPECAFVFSGNVEIDGTGEEIGQSQLWLAEGVHQPRDFAPVLYRHNVISPVSIVARRSAYQAVGPVFDQRFAYFDYEMWFRMAVRFPVGYLAVSDCDYRIHDVRETNEPGRHGGPVYLGEQMLAFLDHVDALMREWLPDTEIETRLQRRKRSFHLLVAALDEAAQRRRRRSLASLGRAVRTYPPSIVDPRVPACLVALGLGPVGARALTRLRLFVLRRRLNIHLRS